MSATAAALWRCVRLLALTVFAAFAMNLPLPGGGFGTPAIVAGRSVRQPAQQANEEGPNDPFYGSSTYRWVYDETHLGESWASTQGDPSVVVAVIDTAADASVPDLRGATLPGWNVDAGNADTSDENGHGTSVASLIAARSDNGIGIAGACGRCSILPVRVSGPDGAAPVGNLASGITWAVDHGARVINVSFAVHGLAPELADAVAYAEQRGAVIVAAAGNDDATTADYPAALPGVVSVEAATAGGSPYSFSNHGAAVTLSAPGCAIVAMAHGG